MAKTTAQRKSAGVLPAPPVAVARRGVATTPAETAVATILEPLTRREGFRHGWLGDTRMGKTYANRALIEAALSRGVDLVLTLDDKGPTAQYAGTQRANPAELRSSPVEDKDDCRRIVFRGHTLRTGKTCSAEEISTLVLDQLRATGVLVCVDELRRAASPAGLQWRGEHTPRLFSEGGGLGISVVWTTQSPQRIPLEAFDQSETIGLFRMRGRALNYLVRNDVIDDDRLVELLPTLQKGEWVLFERSEPWDGRVYKF